MKEAARLESVQALRGIAVLAVVISHAMHEIGPLTAGHLLNFNEKRFPGDFGVDLFFVISGFVMVYVSRDVFGMPGAALEYLRRRIVRIVPLYWVMTTLMIAVILALPDSVETATSEPRQWLASYFFIPFERASDGLIRPVLALGWSLEYEMLFYGLFALGLFLPMRKAIPTVGLMLFAVWYVGSHSLGDGVAARFLGHSIIFEFAAGMVLGWLFVTGTRLPKAVCLSAGVIGVVLLFVAPAFDDFVDMSRQLHYGIPSTLIVAAAVFFPGVEKVRAGWLALEIGETSYSTYLTHPFVLGALSLAASRSGLGETMDAQQFLSAYLLAAIAACLLTGYITHYLVDVPLARRARALLPSASKPASKNAAGTESQIG